MDTDEKLIETPDPSEGVNPAQEPSAPEKAEKHGGERAGWIPKERFDEVVAERNRLRQRDEVAAQYEQIFRAMQEDPEPFLRELFGDDVADAVARAREKAYDEDSTGERRALKAQSQRQTSAPSADLRTFQRLLEPYAQSLQSLHTEILGERLARKHGLDWDKDKMEILELWKRT